MNSRSKFLPKHQTCGSREKAKLLTALSAASACALAHAAPITISGTGSATQDFDALPNTGSTTVWSDDSTLPGWYSQRSGTGTTIIADNGSGSAGGLYSFGSNFDSNGHWDPLVPAMRSEVSPMAFLSRIHPELWRPSTRSPTPASSGGTSGATSAQNITLWYKISPTPITSLSPTSNAGWTAVPSGEFSGPIHTTGTTTLDGNDTANRRL